MNNCIIMRKSGNFYHVFDDDSIIFNFLFGYSNNNSRAGFPIKSINKVINTLDDKCINYKIHDGKEVTEKSFKNKNQYKKILTSAKANANINYKIDLLIEKLNHLDIEQLEDIINIIGEKYDI